MLLKIKKGVDLKELKKYGLSLRYECDHKTGEVWVEEIYKMREKNSMHYSARFAPYGKNKKKFYLQYVETMDIPIIYDLIKDGILEKE